MGAGLVSATLVILSGVLVATGVYLLLTRSLIRIVFGVGLLANGINLMIIATGGRSGSPSFVDAEGNVPANATDPLPQAFVLTSIVISLALVAFLSALAWRSWTIDGLDEVEDDLEDRRLAQVRAREARDLAARVEEELRPLDHEWEARE
jgi:multicomponent Na+:H+ antiporter subunit C